MQNTNKTVTDEGKAPRYSGACYRQNRHWHLNFNGRWTYHNGVKCNDCHNADQKYNIESV